MRIVEARTFVMMGSRVRVTQAAPNFLRKIKGLDPSIRVTEVETLLFAKPLSPRCLQKNAGCRILMANCGAFLASTLRANRGRSWAKRRLEYGSAEDDGGILIQARDRLDFV